MKISLLKSLLLILILPQVGSSQVYTFTTNTQPYQELVSPISINNGEVWSFPDYEVDMGYNFYVFDTLVSKLYFFNEGQGSVLSSAPSTVRYHKMIMPFGAGLIDRGYPGTQSLSPLSYEVSGEPGARICKIQWKNAGFYSDYESNGSTTDYVNFQLWLHEVTGLMEMHYGPSLITDPDIAFGAPGPTIGLIPWYDNDEYLFSPQSMWLVGDPSAPSLVYMSDFNALSGMIPPNTAYYFTNTLTVNTIRPDHEIVAIYPNPASEFIVIDYQAINQHDQLIIEIRDCMGRSMLKTIFKSTDELRIPVTGMPNGAYMISVSDSRGQGFTRIFLKK